jgi:uncharacterized membrane protein
MWLTYLLICLVAILIIVDYYPNVDARIVGLLIGVVCVALWRIHVVVVR